ncbi:MAG: undecaprenyl-diphosphatase UppP [Fimbriiglobus sp.]
MSIWEATLLGVVQGLTEFLPISSTAHLVVARKLLGHEHAEDAFTTVIQLGTLFAVFAYFRTDILNILKAVLQDFRTLRPASSPESRLAWLIVLGSIPVIGAGFTLKKWLKANFFDVQTMAFVAILFAGLMICAELWCSIRKDQGRPETDEQQVSWFHALFVGCWQALALMPGASRSGTTITGGLFAGLSRTTAARFSFLLSLPSITGAGLKELYDEYKKFKNPQPGEPLSLFASTDDLLSLGVGLVVSGVVGYFAVAWLMHLLKRYSLWVFIIYRIILGIALIALVQAGIAPR